jgi:uncharacterized membrane protein YoaK (UPF0700 family)
VTPTAVRPALLPPPAQAALLAAIAGYVDAVGFLRYHGFACQITGNTVLLALALFQRSWEQSLYYVAMITCFTVGVLLASGLIRFGRSPSLVLSLAAAAVALCSVIGLKWVSPLLGLAMGMQTAAATRFGRATLNTVFITGDAQRLFEGVVALLWPRPGIQLPEDVGPLALVWLVYFCGALTGAFADLSFRYALLIPAAILPFVLLRRRG